MEIKQSQDNWDQINYFDKLPEGCIADVLSQTTPVDASRVTLVAPSFRLIADSDAVWERFLPSDYRQLISRAVPPNHGSIEDLVADFSKKELYLFICDHPLIIDGGALSFSMDKRTGKKCFMIAARELAIVWGDTPRYWRWTSHPESRFEKVVELISVCWLEIHGRINTSLLSRDTAYAAYLVYKPSQVVNGFEDQPMDISVGIIGEEKVNGTVYLDPEGRKNVTRPRRRGLLHNFRPRLPRPQVAGRIDADSRYTRIRKDGWLEIELGEYFHRGGENRILEITLMEVKGGNWKSGLIIQGLEIRPKCGN